MAATAACVSSMTRIITVSLVVVSMALGVVPCTGPTPVTAASRESGMTDCAREMTASHHGMPRPASPPLDCCVLAATRDVAVLTPVATVQVPWRAVVHAALALVMPAENAAPANERAALARSAPRSAPATALLI